MYFIYDTESIIFLSSPQGSWLHLVSAWCSIYTSIGTAPKPGTQHFVDRFHIRDKPYYDDVIRSDSVRDIL